MKKTILNISYKSPTGIDHDFDHKILKFAKQFGGKEGGSGFDFGTNRRDFDVCFKDGKQAVKVGGYAKRFRSLKVKTECRVDE